VIHPGGCGDQRQIFLIDGLRVDVSHLLVLSDDGQVQVIFGERLK
jgi:hypothetical protein